MKRWTEETWKEDYPARHKSVINALAFALKDAGGHPTGGDDIIGTMFIRPNKKTDTQSPCIQISNVTSHLFQDGIRLRFNLDMFSSSFHDTCEGIDKMKVMESWLKSNGVTEEVKEYPDDHNRFQWVMWVRYDEFESILTKLVHNLK